MSVFNGSIAQKNVQFPIETVVEPLDGANYARALIFISDTDAATFLTVDDKSAGKMYELKSNNYETLTAGSFKAKLEKFFDSAKNAVVGVAIFNTQEPEQGETAENTLADVYAQYKMYAYFKFNIFEDTGYLTDLSNLCKQDPLYSDLWIGTSDSNVLVGTSVLITDLVRAESNARVIFNADATIDPALAQLGATLSTVNGSGTPVGNNIDMDAFGTIKASGALVDNERQNLTPEQVLSLDNQHIGYQTWVGDGTENVVTEGSLSLQGESVGANWVKNYITYMAKVRTARYITQMNVFMNNASYQAILLLLSDIVQKFVNIGRLSGFLITAPEFADLPKSADTIVVNNAWQADYIDNVREVTIYGTLYLKQPVR